VAHCELYKFNDPKIPEGFVKNAVRKLQKMVADLRAQLAEKDMLVADLRAQLADKDMLLLHMGMPPDSEIGAENDALPEEKSLCFFVYLSYIAVCSAIITDLRWPCLVSAQCSRSLKLTAFETRLLAQ